MHVGMKLYDSGIYFVFLTKSAPSAPASQREILCLFKVFIYLILTWKQSAIHWYMCGESRIPKRWCNERVTCWELQSIWLNFHQRWQLYAHPWTHTGTGLNRYINLHNNWTEKSCFLSQCTVSCCVRGTLIKRARSEVNILCATGSSSSTSYGTWLTFWSCPVTPTI